MARPVKWDYTLIRPGEKPRAFRRRMFLEQQTCAPAMEAAPHRVSKRYDPDGSLRGYSTFQTTADVDRMQDWATVRSAFLDKLPIADPVDYSPKENTSTALACFPIGDHHLGMLAWRPEVGASYDLEIGERLLAQAMRQLMLRTSYAERALIVGLGDFMHYDGKMPITFRGGNMLDAEGRYRKMIRVAIRAWRDMIEKALSFYKSVWVIVASGNHDEFSMAFISEALAMHYQGNTRVHIDTTPGRFHYYRYGGNLIGVTHGDLAKPDQLPGIMTTDRPKDWAETTHRTWWTGHVHRQADIPYAGCNVETFGILPPTDAWAHGMGYRGRREMKAIVLNEQGGEYARYTITPEELN